MPASRAHLMFSPSEQEPGYPLIFIPTPEWDGFPAAGEKTSRRADFFSETLDKDAIIWYYKNNNIKKQDERRIKNEKGEANQGEQDDGRWWGYQV